MEFAQQFLPLLNGPARVTAKLSTVELTRLTWAALMLGRDRDLPKLLQITPRDAAVPQLPAIFATFVQHSSEDLANLRLPGVPDPRTAVANAMLQRGQVAEALETYDQILADCPYDFEALYRRANVYQECDRHIDASRDLKDLYDRYT